MTWWTVASAGIVGALVLLGLAFILTLETSWPLRLAFAALFAMAVLIGTI